eukprot:8204770-Pyramimonas_sp.AAC.1
MPTNAPDQFDSNRTVYPAIGAAVEKNKTWRGSEEAPSTAGGPQVAPDVGGETISNNYAAVRCAQWWCRG